MMDFEQPPPPPAHQPPLYDPNMMHWMNNGAALVRVDYTYPPEPIQPEKPKERKR
jgi:hypothetical protein